MSDVEAFQARRLLDQADRLDGLRRSPVVDGLALRASFRLEEVDPEVDRADLRHLCDLLAGPSGAPAFQLSDAVRVASWARLLERDGIAALAAMRRSLGEIDRSPLQDMIDRVVDPSARPEADAPIALLREDQLLSLLRVRGWLASAATVSSTSVEQPSLAEADEIRARLELMGITRPVRELVAHGCVGRDRELALMRAYCDSPRRPGPLHEDPALLVFGIGGVGKSTLMGAFVMALIERQDRAGASAWAYVDLDRPGLSAGDPQSILDDVARQFGAQHPQVKRRYSARNRDDAVKKRVTSGSVELDRSVWRDTAVQLAADVVELAEGRLVVVIDTFEESSRADPVGVRALYDLFDLLALEIPSFKLVISGRAPAAPPLRTEHADRLLHVAELDLGPALELLGLFLSDLATDRAPVTIDDALGRDVYRLVGGNPLTLRIAARVLVEAGPAAIADASARSTAIDRVRHEFVAGFLYQRVLGHLRAPDDIADAVHAAALGSLVLRRITVELLDRVVLPVVGAAVDAESVFLALAAETGLMEPAGDGLRVRDELRAPALRAFELEDAQLVDALHDRAAEYFRGLEDLETTRIDIAYHSLAGGLPPGELPDEILGPDVAQALDNLAGFLPVAAAAALRAVAERPDALSHEREQLRWEQGAETQATSAISKREPESARAILAERATWSVGTRLYGVRSQIEELEDDIPAAVRSALADMEAAAAAQDTARYAAAAVRVARLEESQGDSTSAGATLRAAFDSPTVAGAHEIRLELALTLMTTVERSGGDADQRWNLGLEARSVLQRLGPDRVRQRPGLVWLLAMAIGDEDPEWLREAITGGRLFEYVPDSPRIAALAAAMAEWDCTRERPSLPSYAGFETDTADPTELLRLWTAHAQGYLAEQAVATLASWWANETPPEAVREALRQLLLWWNAPADPLAAGAADPGAAPGDPVVGGAEHFLDVPFDIGRSDAGAFARLLGGALDDITDLQVLAGKANLDLTQIDWSKSAHVVLREVLADAQVQGQMADLMRTLLGDQALVSFRDEIQDLVGTDWLQQNDVDPPTGTMS